MRILAVAGILGLALLANVQTVSTAEAGVAFCARYTDGGTNCGFYSFRQCLAAISGVGGFCHVAPYQGTDYVYGARRRVIVID